MRKRFGILLLVLFTAVFLSACGESGGGGVAADTMTVTIGGNSQLYTEGPINSYGYYDPYMEADIYQDTGRTIIMLTSGETGIGMPPTLVNIVTSGHAEGDYPITGGSGTPGTTYVAYTDHGQHYDSIVSSGTVTIESIGNVGQPVIGSFSAVVALSTAPGTTLAISGTFNVMREN
jgi:hypothetical protein